MAHKTAASTRYLADRKEHNGGPNIRTCVTDRQFAHCLHTLQSSFAAPWPGPAPLRPASRCRYLVVATFRLISAEVNNIDGVRAHKFLYSPNTSNRFVAVFM
jgi:hypothetical protein